MGECTNIEKTTEERTQEEKKERERWTIIKTEMDDYQTKIIEGIEELDKTTWAKFQTWLTYMWAKHKNKLELIIIIIIIVIDREWIDPPAWYGKVLFYGSLLYAVLTNRDLAAAVAQIGNWLDKRKQISTIMDMAKASIEVGKEEAARFADKLNEILANDPPERRQEIIDLIKPLVSSTVDTRDSLVEVCNILTEMDTT